ncbi:MAG: M48 family metallopeptidase [Kofleriaceae bacterium]|nr:M48 family metallopeptidase [Kofleriaceae bacterium]
MRGLQGKTRLALLAVAGLALPATGCKLNLTPETLIKGVQGYVEARKDLTPENEYFVGRSVGTNILARNNYAYLDKDGWSRGQLNGFTLYVNAVGAVLANAALDVQHSGDRPAPIAGWHFVILDDSIVNAFAAPGGYIFITRGALQLASNEDELAAVLAHEIAHVRRGHALGSIKKSRISSVYKEALTSSVELDQQALGGLAQAFDGAMDDMLDSLLVKGYSRDTEFEADAIGMEIMAKAGYNTDAFVAYLDRLQRQQATGSGGFSATHPKASDRVATLKKIRSKYQMHPVVAKRTARFVAARAAATL